MHVSMWNQHLCVYVDKRTYKVMDQITFRQRDNTWKADKVTSPWVKSVVNRERAKQALGEIGYEEFRAWLKVYMQMATPPTERGYVSAPSKLIVSMLRERSQWRELVTHQLRNNSDNWGNPDRMLHDVRQAIYREYNCIDRKYVPFLG